MLPKSTLRCDDDFEMASLSKTVAGTKKTYHHGNLRAALIEAGLELIAEKGVRAFTLREIGARVGVSRMAAYRHFADKAKLLGAMREAGFAKFAAALEAGRDEAGRGFAARMQAMGVAYVQFAREYPAYFEVMFGGAHDVAVEAEGKCAEEERAFQVLEKAIVDGQARGEARAGDSRLMACAAWSLVHGIGALRLDQMPFAQGLMPADFTIACTNVLLAGLAGVTKK
jgi:AcrR family transcriptional regulator